MESLKEIANIAGKSGLYRILKPSRAGVVVESLDDKKEKMLIGPTARVSILKDISIYTDDENESAPLGVVFQSIYEKYGDELPVSPKTSSNNDFADFLEEVLPAYDRDRVHASDVKKLISWYSILRTNAPELFATAAAEEAPAEQNEEVTVEDKAAPVDGDADETADKA
jgi:hypothetical protein